ncbi:hypothetical protein HYS30_01210 [Candidatus Peregrinibacteria bacterium]|nr:hypothetical protein [Candidatus Peregrinibacteria bacterium]
MPIQQVKAAHFVQAYVASGFNAAEAARKCSRIGSRGGANSQRTAESLGSRMLRDDEVQKSLRSLCEGEDSPLRDRILTEIQRVAFGEDVRNNEKLRALDLLAKTQGMYTETVVHKEMSITDAIQQANEQARPVQWMDIESVVPNQGIRGPSEERDFEVFNSVQRRTKFADSDVDVLDGESQ